MLSIRKIPEIRLIIGREPFVHEKLLNAIFLRAMFECSAGQLSSDKRHDATVAVHTLHNLFIAKDSCGERRINAKPRSEWFCLFFVLLIFPQNAHSHLMCR